jgi:hypothetical protein
MSPTTNEKKRERTQSKHLVERTRYTNIRSIDSFTLLPASHYALLEGQKDFVLLETSRFDGGNRRSFFFLQPAKIISIHRREADAVSISNSVRGMRKVEFIG